MMQCISVGPYPRLSLLKIAVENDLRLEIGWNNDGDQLRLRNIVGGGISDVMWKHTLEHAMSCVSDAKQYVYYCNEGQSNAILFNRNYELKGLICNRQFLDMGLLSSDQKVRLKVLPQFGSVMIIEHAYLQGTRAYKL
ncbi:hypothetical protein NL676_033165 [Syzygium grande]|nr:hypothetical protein NL676_033165 [Syzygium grande]